MSPTAIEAHDYNIDNRSQMHMKHSISSPIIQVTANIHWKNILISPRSISQI